MREEGCTRWCLPLLPPHQQQQLCIAEAGGHNDIDIEHRTFRKNSEDLKWCCYSIRGGSSLWMRWFHCLSCCGCGLCGWQHISLSSIPSGKVSVIRSSSSQISSKNPLLFWKSDNSDHLDFFIFWAEFWSSWGLDPGSNQNSCQSSYTLETSFQ